MRSATRLRAVAVLIALAGTAAALAGCGDGGGSGAASTVEASASGERLRPALLGSDDLPGTWKILNVSTGGVAGAPEGPPTLGGDEIDTIGAGNDLASMEIQDPDGCARPDIRSPNATVLMTRGRVRVDNTLALIEDDPDLLERIREAQRCTIAAARSGVRREADEVERTASAYEPSGGGGVGGRHLMIFDFEPPAGEPDGALATASVAAEVGDVLTLILVSTDGSGPGGVDATRKALTSGMLEELADEALRASRERIAAVEPSRGP